MQSSLEIAILLALPDTDYVKKIVVCVKDIVTC